MHAMAMMQDGRCFIRLFPRGGTAQISTAQHIMIWAGYTEPCLDQFTLPRFRQPTVLHLMGRVCAGCWQLPSTALQN